MLIGTAVIGHGRSGKIIAAAMIGALLPDLSLYLLAGVSIFVLQIPANVVFDELYFSETWQTVFAIDNSFLVWGALLSFSLWRKSHWGIALTLAATLHLMLDFPLHHDDGRPHFWPLTDWVFESPVSYWDRQKGAMWIAPVEAAAASMAAAIVWRQRKGWMLACIVACLLLAEFWIVRQWLFFFVDG